MQYHIFNINKNSFNRIYVVPKSCTKNITISYT